MASYKLSRTDRTYVFNFNRHMEDAAAANGSESPYQARFATKGRSGLSFGKMQNDVSKNVNAENLFRNILEKEGFGDVNNIVNEAKKQGVTKNSFSQQTLDRINRALEKHKSEIDNLDVISFNNAVSHVEKVIDKTGSRGVFNESHPDFHKAIGMAMHWGNQTGNLNRFGDHLSQIKNPSLKDIENYLRNQKNFNPKINSDYQNFDSWLKRINEAKIFADKQADKQSDQNSETKTSNDASGFPFSKPGFPYPWQQPYDPKWKGVPFLPNPFVPDGFGGWFDNGHECLKPWGNIFDPFRRGKYHVYDPLALDLDGDGIETVATKGFAGALFDHRSQGIRTATGWISADDGLLVRDLNGNGIIDNGAELFGDNTKLADGSFAKNGYAALAELDSNGDGIVSAADAAFQTLRVWQDLNQDGISQTNELRTLEELGIQSLDVAYKDVNKNLGNGNTLAQQGSYTKKDGTTAQAGDLLLAADNLYSRFKDKVELTAEQAKAANLSGIGRLRDLREAAALSGDLANVLKAYSAADTKEAQMALLDSLIHEWAETDSEWGKKPPMRLSTDWTQTANEGIALTPSQAERLKNNRLMFLSEKAQAAIDAARDRIAVLDAYTGQDSSTLYYMSEEDALNIVKVTNDTYESLAKNIYQSLLFQTRLLPYLNQISFKMENDTFTLDFSGLVQAFNHVKETNPQKAFVDLAEMLAYGELRFWYEGRRLMAGYVEEAKKAGKFEDYQKVLGEETVALLAKTSGTQADDTLQNVGFGNNKNVSLYGNDGNDTLIGGAGNDYLDGGSGSDTYVFGKGFGQDTVHNYDYSTGRKDIIRFTDGITADMLNFTRSDDDLLIKAKDGSGQVTVQYYFQNDGSGAYRIDEIHFDNGKVLDVAAVKALVQQSTDGSDRLYAYQSGSTLNGGLGDDSLYGANGADTLNGGKGNDWLSGGNGNDMLNGDEGDDRLYGNHGDDVLNGGAGNDGLYGEDGNDTLIGGAGNDYLNGGSGSDTYVFGKGFGQDTVYNYDYSTGRKDIIRFTDGITADMLNFTRSDDDQFAQRTFADGTE